MNFDPAIAAQVALQECERLGELGADFARASEAEETFSTNAGQKAKAAYLELLEIGKSHSHAMAFQEFLIFITWQQVTEETIPIHFQTGLTLCDAYLSHLQKTNTVSQHVTQIEELHLSYRNGLGLDDTDPHDFDEDIIKGGD
jgi:hypothetical protein